MSRITSKFGTKSKAIPGSEGKNGKKLQWGSWYKRPYGRSLRKEK